MLLGIDILPSTSLYQIFTCISHPYTDAFSFIHFYHLLRRANLVPPRGAFIIDQMYILIIKQVNLKQQPENQI